jgi:hypothetical protein
LPIIFGPLGLTLDKAAKLTPFELINLYHGFLWREEKKDERIARFVTLWVANMAGKVNKKPLNMTDIFRDGRFKSRETLDEFMKEFDDQ